VVGEEREAPRVRLLEQDDPGAGGACGVDGRERHRVGLDDAGGQRVGVPAAELGERRRRQRVLVEAAVPVRHTLIAKYGIESTDHPW
jgi:hypothetical protein